MPLYTVHQGNFSFDDVLKFFQQIFCFRISDILTVRPKVIKSLISFGYILSGRSFYEHNDLQGDFKEKQKRFDSFRGVKIDGYSLFALRKVCSLLY